jgi:hypothetical protein
MGIERDKTVDELLRAREAYERHDWAVAFDRMSAVGQLSAEDTLALATSAYLMGDVDQAVRALQGGYQDRIRSGDELGAVRFALWLALVLNLRGEFAIGGGWVAERSGFWRTNPKMSSSEGTCFSTSSSLTSAVGILPEPGR